MTKTILLVEDDPEVQMQVSKMLAELGFDVIIKDTVDDALYDLVTSSHFDGYICDGTVKGAHPDNGRFLAGHLVNELNKSNVVIYSGGHKPLRGNVYWISKPKIEELKRWAEKI